MVRDLGAEGLALVGVCDRGIPRGANHSRRARGHGKSSLFEREHRNLKAFAFFANQVGFRDAHILQTEITSVAGADTELSMYRSRGESFHAAFDDEARHA